MKNAHCFFALIVAVAMIFTCDAPASDSDTDFCFAAHRAKLCNGCGFGNKKNDCAKCGKWVGGTSFPAYICDNCGFGNKKDNCVKCGKWVGGTSVPAVICNGCGFGDKKNACIKCGRR